MGPLEQQQPCFRRPGPGFSVAKTLTREALAAKKQRTTYRLTLVKGPPKITTANSSTEMLPAKNIYRLCSGLFPCFAEYILFEMRSWPGSGAR